MSCRRSSYSSHLISAVINDIIRMEVLTMREREKDSTNKLDMTNCCRFVGERFKSPIRNNHTAKGKLPQYIRAVLIWKARAMRDKVAIITTILPRGQNHLNFKNQPRLPIITHFIGRHIRGILGSPLSRILSPELLLLLDLASVGVNDLLRAAGASHGEMAYLVLLFYACASCSGNFDFLSDITLTEKRQVEQTSQDHKSVESCGMYPFVVFILENTAASS